MKNILIVLFIILLNILNPQYLLARDLKFNRLTAENGLPYSTANVMLQDDNGFLWIGTHTGLCRYDGINTEIYSEFENRQVRSLEETDGNWLWVGMESGLARINLKTRKMESILCEGKKELQRVSAIHWGKDEKVYVAAIDGLFVYDKGILTHVIADEGQVFSILENTLTDYWLLTEKALLNLDTKTGKVTRYAWPLKFNPFFLASLNSYKNILYISAEYNSMLRFDMKNRRFMNEFAIEDKKRTYPLIIDGGQLFVNTTWGIEVLSCTTNQLQYTIAADDDMKNGLRSNQFYSMYKKGTTLWLGIFSGGIAYSQIENDAFNVYRLPGTDFTTFNRQVRSFCIVSDDIKLIGTRNGLLLVSEKEKRVQTFTTQDYPALLSNSILFIQPFGGDDYLIGTTKGLVLFSLKKNSFRTFSEENVYKGTQFYSCLSDEEGIWLATSEKVLYYNMHTNQTDIYLLDTNKYPGCSALSLCFDSRNRLWIGTSDGIFLLDKVTRKIMDTFEGKDKLKNISKAQINNISRSKNGKIFICTDRMGLIVLNERGTEIDIYSEDNILPHNTVYSVYEDEQNVWWIATMKGILRYNRVTNKKQLYDLSAGIPGGVCRSFSKDSQGRYWWANEMGLVVCDPYLLSQAVLCDLPRISSVKVAGKRQQLLEDQEQGPVTPAYAKSMVLPAFQNNLELCFSMHTYLGALDSYQYILEGFDERWKYNIENNCLSYTDLPAGKYLLRVRGQGNSDYETQLEIIVEYPWYVTYGIAAVVVIIVLLGIGWKYWRRKVAIVGMKQDADDELLNAAAYRPKTPRSSQEKLDRLYEQLIDYFETEKPYLNKQLKSADIAAALSCSISSLSECLSFKLNTNFSDFVAHYRVEAFVQKQKQEDISLYTLMSIAESCGFNSKSSFFRLFKKQMGCTPLEYIQKQEYDRVSKQ
ncbi:two-component regulator propeller domain-containing protein [Bacteroides ovatus]|uniref:two-component regulator propeller domain-containing protein n=1 Tax=Bacteroides ovatus TaxID=28116 RepID=UPI00203002E4|nr:two-component regulator propeller domain-containing protein [Bacteroides ovatus]MCM1722822.1 helix-turn-helix domain-containing protein [Bacteroides ovatus]MCM1757235.1 helix-turn-helix domain-containing protein [Bacteroides ovatus]MCM1868262.1 helix-turn-helix domain-containing protein [Bacteroides ovatus]MCM1910825.1 helix-turn-helix domain-containing protein [Bacteroides ovatus]